jgi:hypothetical protein
MGHPGEVVFKFHWAGRFTQTRPTRLAKHYGQVNTDYYFLLDRIYLIICFSRRKTKRLIPLRGKHSLVVSNGLPHLIAYTSIESPSSRASMISTPMRKQDVYLWA